MATGQKTHAMQKLLIIKNSKILEYNAQLAMVLPIKKDGSFNTLGLKKKTILPKLLNNILQMGN